MDRVMERIKAFFGHPSLRIMVHKELEEARKDLLVAQTDRDYAEAMIQFQEAKVKRLLAMARNMDAV